MDKILKHTVKLDCDVKRCFDFFTHNELLQLWLCPLADVEPEVGGKYELFWNPDDKENDSTIGCRITAIEPGKYLSFEWKGPSQFKHFMNNADPLSHVVVFFIPLSTDGKWSSCTEVNLIHSGWRNSDNWEEARLWFQNAWSRSFEELPKVAKRKNDV